MNKTHLPTVHYTNVYCTEITNIQNQVRKNNPFSIKVAGEHIKQYKTIKGRFFFI